jgi:small subunit ribosomal protein S9
MSISKKARSEISAERKGTVAQGVGRRKKSVARVFLRYGSGVVTVNGTAADTYFDTDIARLAVKLPFKAFPDAALYDVHANVVGGGLHGQADAVKLGISRALLQARPETRAVLREHGLLTVDARVKERKKYGKKAARRSFQFVKR